MPFNKNDLEDYILRHQLSTEISQYLRGAEAGLSRGVGTTAYRSIVSEFPSTKMGRSVVVESRRGELAYAICAEYASDVVAYYEQPPAVDCVRTNKNGHRVTRLYHPDFLVLAGAGPVVVQVKTEDTLVSLTQERATDWQLVDDVYHDRPAEKAFVNIGLSHIVVSTASLPRIRVSNLTNLLRVRASNEPPATAQFLAQVRRQFSDRAVMTIGELARRLGLVARAPLLRLIDEGLLFATIDRQLLTDDESCLVSLLPELLEEGVRRSLSGTGCTDSVSLEACPPHHQAEQAVASLSRLKDGTLPKRTARRLRQKIRAGRTRGLSDLQAVTPRTFRSGNRTEKRPPEVLGLARETARELRASPLRLSASAALKLYRARALEAIPGAVPVSRKTFEKMFNAASQEGARLRGGNRLANAHESPTSVDDRAISAQRPFEIASCDHYLADVECILLRAGRKRYTRRPWITVLRDAYTGAVLSVWVSFRAPSRHACAMVLRSCLRQHGRLPECIVVDHGAEFRSVYFAALLAHCGITLMMRPVGHPRYGSEAERYFGLFITQWLVLRPGNLAMRVESRSVSASHSASALAELEPADLLAELWAYSDWLMTVVSPSQAAAPAVLLEQGLQRHPYSGVQLRFDDDFVLATCIETRQITLDPSRGLRIGANYFWAPFLAAPSLTASKIEVRIDPENASVVHARIGTEWKVAKSSRHPSMSAKALQERLAESLVYYEGANVREEAMNQANLELVRRVEEVDAERMARKSPVRDVLPEQCETASPPCDPDFGFDLDEVGTPLLSVWGGRHE